MNNDAFSSLEHIHDCFSVVIVGDSNVGKTSILSKYCNNVFTEQKQINKAIETYTKTIRVKDKMYKLKLWDIQYNESNFKLNQQIYERTDCVVFAYAVNDKESFVNVKKWFNILADIMDVSDKQMIMIGNKIDLEDERVVGADEGRSQAESMQIEYYEVSCVTGEGMNTAFECLVNKAVSNTYKDNLMELRAQTNASSGNCAT